MIKIQCAILLFCIVLAVRDGINYRIYKVPPIKYAKLKLWQRYWHWVGGFVYAIPCTFIVYEHGLKYIIPALIIRAGFYDPAHNKPAGLKWGHIGTEADFDKFFSKIFGSDGAVKKLIVSLIVLIGLNIYYALR